MRRVELLIDHVKRAVESQLDSSGGGISDEEILEYLNEAQYQLYCGIVQKYPDLLLTDSFISLVANQEAYELPTDLHLGTSIKHVWHKYGNDSGDYRQITQMPISARNSGVSSGSPSGYIRQDNDILLVPVPSAALTNGIRLTYQKRLRRLDIRRGIISSITKTGTTLDTITIDTTPGLPKDSGTVTAAKNILNKTDYISVVDNDGVAILNAIPVDSYDASTGAITVKASYTTAKTQPDFAGAYVVAGEFATTHCDMPDDTVERYLLTYARLDLLRRTSNPEEYNAQLRKLGAIQQNILDSYETPDQDIKLMYPDSPWSGFVGVGGSSISNGSGGSGGSGASSTYSVSNVGLSGEGLFKEEVSNTFRFFNIDVDTGISVAQDIVNDTIDIGLSHLGLEDLTDPGADRALFWDDSASTFAWLTLGTGLSLTGTTLTSLSTSIEVDGSSVSTGSVVLDFDSGDFLLTESPTDDFDITIVDSGIDHDATTNFVANEHIDHTAVTITAGTNLSGGGDLASSFTLDVDDSFILNTGDIGTGSYDFGGADDFEIPNGAAPVVDTAGQIAIDTSITDLTGMIKYHDGVEELLAIAIPTANLTTSDGYILSYNAANNEFDMIAGSTTDHGGLTGLTDDDHTQYSLLSSQAGAPSSTPTRVGEINVDTTGDRFYISTDTASSADWDIACTPTSTDTLTNKTINTASNTLTVVEADISDLQSYLLNVVEDTTPQLGGHLDVNGQVIGDGTRELLTFIEDGSAVNHINIENQATGAGPILSAVGDDANIDLHLANKGTGALTVDGTATSAAEIRLAEDTDNGTNYMGLKSPAAVTSSTTLTLPDGDGNADDVVVTNGSGTLSWLPKGRLVQQAYTQTATEFTITTTMPIDDTVPQNTEGDEIVTVSITPKNSSNILEIICTINTDLSDNNSGGVALFQDTTAGALSARPFANSSSNVPKQTVTLRYFMEAGTSSSTTFKCRVGPASTITAYVNRQTAGGLFGNVIHSSIVVKEYEV